MKGLQLSVLSSGKKCIFCSWRCEIRMKLQSEIMVSCRKADTKWKGKGKMKKACLCLIWQKSFRVSQVGGSSSVKGDKEREERKILKIWKQMLLVYFLRKYLKRVKSKKILLIIIFMTVSWSIRVFTFLTGMAV